MEDKVQDKYKGKFIVLDGPDGCGKSTQAELLTEWLSKQGVTVSKFRDPGGTAIGEKIREILLNPEHLAMDTGTELLLYMAARVQLWVEKIRPALQAGHCVVMDRWLSSTCAYQGNAGGLGIEKIIKIAEDCLEKIWPDVTIILDIDHTAAAGRIKRQFDRMEAKGGQYHRKVREGFLSLADGREGFFVVNAADDVSIVHNKILQIISEVSFK